VGSRRPPLSRAPLRPSRPSRPARNLLGTVSSAAQTAPSGPSGSFGPSGSGRGVRVRTPGPRAVLAVPAVALPTSHCPIELICFRFSSTSASSSPDDNCASYVAVSYYDIQVSVEFHTASLGTSQMLPFSLGYIPLELLT
jgi:hypothetical protein